MSAIPEPLHTPRVVFLGFSAFEHSAMSSAFRLQTQRAPRYEIVPGVGAAQFLVANADHATTVQAVLAAGRLAQTVFIGGQAPSGAAVWLRRPIDPLQVMRELDRMTTRAGLPGLHSGAPAQGPPALQAQPPLRPGAPALLVDDSPIALRYLQKCLLPYTLQSDVALGSAKAIELIAHHAYRFVFIDVELGPDSPLDGLALCQHLKRHPHSTDKLQPVVVMVSAHHSEIDRARGSLAGCDAYLGKPLQPTELSRLMKRHGLRHAGQDVAAPT